MLKGKELNSLMKFITGPHWRDAYKEVLQDHFADRIDEVNASEWTMALWFCALDDFLTAQFGTDNVNPIDDYIKRRGHKIRANTKSYLQSLRGTGMSLYAVSGVTAAAFTLRELIRNGDATDIKQTALTHHVKRGDIIAARVVPVHGGHVLANGTLPFDWQRYLLMLDGLLKVFGENSLDTPSTITGENLRNITVLFTATFMCGGFPARIDPNKYDCPSGMRIPHEIDPRRLGHAGALFN